MGTEEFRIRGACASLGFHEAHGFVEVGRVEFNKRGTALPFVLMERRDIQH